MKIGTSSNLISHGVRMRLLAIGNKRLQWHVTRPPFEEVHQGAFSCESFLSFRNNCCHHVHSNELETFIAPLMLMVVQLTLVYIFPNQPHEWGDQLQYEKLEKIPLCSNKI